MLPGRPTAPRGGLFWERTIESAPHARITAGLASNARVGVRKIERMREWKTFLFETARTHIVGRGVCGVLLHGALLCLDEKIPQVCSKKAAKSSQWSQWLQKQDFKMEFFLDEGLQLPPSAAPQFLALPNFFTDLSCVYLASPVLFPWR